MSFLANSSRALFTMGALSLIAFPLAAKNDSTPFDRSDSVDHVVEDTETKNQQAQAEPTEDVKESGKILQKMQSDPDMKRLLDQAEGVFVIPQYVAAALIVGGSGGEGVLLTREEGEWSNPAFYDVGELDIGAQAGASAGSIAMVLTSEQAIDSFREENNFALTADAGYSIANWSERAQGEIGMENDVIVWTDTEGLLGELSVGVTGISFDEEESQEYYGQQATPQQILAGEVEDPQEQALQQAMREQ